jgi:hypothetical protein
MFSIGLHLSFVNIIFCFYFLPACRFLLGSIGALAARRMKKDILFRCLFEKPF